MPALKLSQIFHMRRSKGSPFASWTTGFNPKWCTDGTLMRQVLEACMFRGCGEMLLHPVASFMTLYTWMKDERGALACSWL